VIRAAAATKARQRMTLLIEPAAPPVQPAEEVTLDQLHRLSVAHYHAMIAAGILGDGDPVELLEGVLVRKMPKNPPHRIAMLLVKDALTALLPPGWFLDVQDPLTTPESEPEPDILVIRGRIRDYTHRDVEPQDAGLVVEVADSSLRHDRTVKLRIYARARVALYWIVNLNDRQIEVHTEPTGPAKQPAYGQRRDYGEQDAVPVVLDGREIGTLLVRDLLP
jgi:Uma2 family endonuclease